MWHANNSSASAPPTTPSGVSNEGCSSVVNKLVVRVREGEETVDTDGVTCVVSDPPITATYIIYNLQITRSDFDTHFPVIYGWSQCSRTVERTTVVVKWPS